MTRRRVGLVIVPEVEVRDARRPGPMRLDQAGPRDGDRRRV